MVQCPINLECKPIVQCANQDELKLNSRKLNYCGWRFRLPMVCCKKSTRSRNEQFRKDEMENQNLPNHNFRNNHLSKKRNNKNFEICGTRIKQISMYIVGGSHVVSVTKYPWFASIALIKDNSYLNDQDKNETNSNLHHYCGSSIITDQFLISSAHCFPISGVDDLDLSSYRIGVGDIELDKMKIYEIEQVFIHPNASTEHHYNDVALIKLKNKLKFNSRIRPVCLPFLDFSDSDEIDESTNNDSEFRNEKLKNEKLKNDNEKEDSNKFNSPDQELPFYGFPNPNYRPLPFYGFRNPNYQPNLDSSFQFNQDPYSKRSTIRRSYPRFRYSNRFSSNNDFYQLRSKRSNRIKFGQNELYNELFTRTNLKIQVAGMGVTQFMGLLPPALKEADLVIVNKEKCNEMYMKLNSTSLKNGLTEEFICAADKRLAKELNSDLIDARRNRPNLIRSKRTIKYWINYFADRFKENQTKRSKTKETNRRSVDKLDNKRDKIDKTPSNNTEDLVNLLTEEELREKLILSDSCQGKFKIKLIIFILFLILFFFVLKIIKSIFLILILNR